MNDCPTVVALWYELTPYHAHALTRIHRELGDVRMVNVFTHSVTENSMPWQISLPEGLEVRFNERDRLVGELAPDAGAVKWTESAEVGYYAQDHAHDFEDDVSLFDWMGQWTQGEQTIRGTLGRMLFSNDEIQKSVKVISGPLADFSGEIAEINDDSQKLKVLVSIFGRETPVEVNYDQVKKI